MKPYKKKHYSEVYQKLQFGRAYYINFPYTVRILIEIILTSKSALFVNKVLYILYLTNLSVNTHQYIETVKLLHPKLPIAFFFLVCNQTHMATDLLWQQNRTTNQCLLALSGRSLLLFGARCLWFVNVDVLPSVHIRASLVLRWGWMHCNQNYMERPGGSWFCWASPKTRRGSRGFFNDKATHHGTFYQMTAEEKVCLWCFVLFYRSTLKLCG